MVPESLTGNVKQVVPLLGVKDMERSLRFYVDGLGFTLTNKWVVDERIRWCWIQLGGSALMLQEYVKTHKLAQAPDGTMGVGVTLHFTCEDAVGLYREMKGRGLKPTEPQVGNGMWETQVSDPDAYRLGFDSPTDVAEETMLSEVEGA